MATRAFPFDGTYTEDELHYVRAYLESGYWDCLKPDPKLEEVYNRREARRKKREAQESSLSETLG